MKNENTFHIYNAYISADPARFALKVSKSQKYFFSKLHCPKREQNIRQNSALEFKKWVNQQLKTIFHTNYVK